MKTPPPASARAGSLRILCAEDDPVVAQYMVKLFTLAGHSVIHVPNGSDAWEVMLESSADIDLVITDNQLPGFTGLELVQLIRQTAYRGGLIVHCGALNERDRANYFALKVDCIVLKNVSPVELLAVVKAIGDRMKPSD